MSSLTAVWKGYSSSGQTLPAYSTGLAEGVFEEMELQEVGGGVDDLEGGESAVEDLGGDIISFEGVDGS